MTEKKLTREQSNEANLTNDFYRFVTGNYELKKNPNKFGSEAYEIGKHNLLQLMNKEEAQNMSLEERKKAQGLGIDQENMSYINNDYLLMKISEIKQASMAQLKLKKLEEVVKKIDPNFNFTVDESIKDLTYMDLVKKMSEKEELGKPEEAALKTFNYLNLAYTGILAHQQSNSGYIENINNLGQALNKEYFPKEVNKEDKETEAKE